MKQYTTPEQTAKLVELGFEKPKSISGYCQRGPYEYDAETNMKMVVYDDTQYPIYAYSIGELIEILHCLPMVIDISGASVVSSGLGRGYGIYTQSKELIDALFEQIVKLREEGVICPKQKHW